MPRGFPASERFREIKQLGFGGMGVVFEAEDRRTGARVALKTLRLNDAAALARFKREFRALQDLHHPGLVSLFELIEEGGEWFFTMELVDGIDFLSHVRPRSAAAPLALAPTVRGGAFADTAPQPPPAVEGSLDVARLRDALAQLAAALVHVHGAGRVHRDLKPGNTLIDRRGRLVLIDFGLAADEDRARDSTLGAIVGTAAYMAPEQARGEPATPAADWYAVGVMLYEALSGHLPFEGPAARVVFDKQRLGVPALDDGPAPELRALCHELLCLDPAGRPSGDDVLGRLRVEVTVRPPSRGTALIGRDRELDTLLAALARTGTGATEVLLIHGESGVGKTALVRELAQRARDGDALVLGGRCHEHELVPYKAFDGVIDELAWTLRGLPAAEAAAMLPRDASVLVQAFPTLGRVEAFARAPRPRREVVDRVEVRSRAFAALRETFARIAERRSLVVLVDDAHWADDDSAALMRAVLAEPEAPPLLVVATARTADVALFDGVPAVQRLAVEPLGEAAACALAASLLSGLRTAPPAGSAAQIARESGGHPLFLGALVQHLAAGQLTSDLRLDDALRARFAAVAPRARDVLELLCLASGPLDLAVVERAAEVPAEVLLVLQAELRAASLVRTIKEHGRELLDVFHDRVRVAAIGELDAAHRAELHRRLAVAHERAGIDDPEILALHFHEAGDDARADRYVLAAAERASRALAFGRAAMLLQRALARAAGDDARSLRIRLGDALVGAGRGGEAARCYLEAALAGDAREALSLRQRAVLHFLVSGHLDEGLRAAGDVVAAAGMRMPRPGASTLWAFVRESTRMRLRGRGFRLRVEADVDRAVLDRIDACWSLAVGLGLVDVVLGRAFAARGLRLALDSGEPKRIARMAAVVGGQLSTGTPAEVARAGAMFELAERLAADLDDPYTDGLLGLMRGLGAYLRGLLGEARTRCETAEQLLRERCTDAAFEIDNSQVYGLSALLQLGELGQLRERVAVALRDADERGDLFGSTNLRTRIAPFGMLAADAPALARREVDEALARWPRRGSLQHYFALESMVHVDLYEGDAAGAHRRITEGWAAIAAGLLLRVQAIRLNLHVARARATLAAITTGALERSALRQVEVDVRVVASVYIPSAAPHAALLRAGVAWWAGDRARVAGLLDDAAARYAAASMALMAAIACRARAVIAGDAAGHDEADAEMRRLGVSVPERFAAMMAPGLPAISSARGA